MVEKRVEGKVIQAFGNLLHVAFSGRIYQGEVAFIYVEDTSLKAEVIEICEEYAKVQCFEDTRKVSLGQRVEFSGMLLEAELGPGLLSSIVDGLQNPLSDVEEKCGFFLKRGVYCAALNRDKKWRFTPFAQAGQTLKRGDVIGTVPEGNIKHAIMIPFKMYGQYEITWIAPEGSYTVDHVIAKVLDKQGEEHELTMVQYWPMKAPLIVGEKIPSKELMDTGCRVIDTQFPIIKGGTFCIPGPFGAGKTVLQHHLSKYSSVDIVIIVACGERAGEITEVLKTFPYLKDPHTNMPLMGRTIIICNTSSMPVSAREASIYLGVTIAEYYRQMGVNILLLADSTSRWAQAMREISGRLEEIPGEEAFPAYLSSRIASFYERAGSLKTDSGEVGSLTIGGTVSPAGGNFEEPVTQSTLSVVGAFLGLSRTRSDTRRYPAIDPLISWSQYSEKAGMLLNEQLSGWFDIVKKAENFLKQGDLIGKRMEVVGEEGIALEDLIIYFKADLYDFSYLQQNSFDVEDSYCPLEKQISLLKIIRLILDGDFFFDSRDDARNYFLRLRSNIKNLNMLPLISERYKNLYEEIKSSVVEKIGVEV